MRCEQQDLPYPVGPVGPVGPVREVFPQSGAGLLSLSHFSVCAGPGCSRLARVAAPGGRSTLAVAADILTTVPCGGAVAADC